MGLNAYLEAIVTKGSTQSATAAATTQTIDGKAGKRIAILRYSFTGNVSCPTAYIQSAIEATTGTAAVGATSITVAAMLGTIASGDNIAFMADNGTWQYGAASAGATSTVIGLNAAATVTTAMTATPLYWLGPYNGSAAATVALTAGFAATTGNSDIACFVAGMKGSPMRFHIPTGATSQPTNVDYVTAGYINV